MSLARARCVSPWARTLARGVRLLLVVTLAVPLSPASGSPVPARVDGSAGAVPTISVRGDIPYAPDPGETAVTPPSASCNRFYKVLDLGLYVSELAAFKADHAPDAANLLAHWWAGSGRSVNYGGGSVLAATTAKFPQFQAMNADVAQYVREMMAEGMTNITVPANPGYTPTAQRPLVVMNFNNVVNFPSLYWAFRTTQGIKVTGTLRDQGGRYTGDLTYVISDTYGFRGNDPSPLTGPFTRAMNYLQTNCGHPKYSAGPLWFSDTLTVAVKFSAPLGGSPS
jgi:hypothetical protein